MAAVRHFEFHNFFINQHLTVLEPKLDDDDDDWTIGRSSKSDDSRPRYSDETIFKMAAVRHLEFSKIVNLVN